MSFPYKWVMSSIWPQLHNYVVQLAHQLEISQSLTHTHTQHTPSYIPPSLVELLVHKGQSLSLPLLPEDPRPIPHPGLPLQHCLLLAGHL